MHTRTYTHLYSIHASRTKLWQEFFGRLCCLRNSQYVECQYRNDLTQIQLKDSRKPTAWPVSPPHPTEDFQFILMERTRDIGTSDEVFCARWAVVYWDYREACGLIACVKAPSVTPAMTRGTHPRQSGTGFASCQRQDKPWVSHSLSNLLHLIHKIYNSTTSTKLKLK